MNRGREKKKKTIDLNILRNKVRRADKDGRAETALRFTAALKLFTSKSCSKNSSTNLDLLWKLTDTQHFFSIANDHCNQNDSSLLLNSKLRILATLTKYNGRWKNSKFPLNSLSTSTYYSTLVIYYAGMNNVNTRRTAWPLASKQEPNRSRLKY